jgi:hypothetical protein
MMKLLLALTSLFLTISFVNASVPQMAKFNKKSPSKMIRMLESKRTSIKNEINNSELISLKSIHSKDKFKRVSLTFKPFQFKSENLTIARAF